MKLPGKKILSLTIISLLIGIITYINVNKKANYIWKAYFYPGSDSIIRGYPTISHPKNFTGTWTDYSYKGKVLATQEYVNGIGHGEGKFYDDNGNIYFSRTLKNGEFESSGESKGVPQKVKIPWFFPQRWINRSLDRLKIWDELFRPKPVVYIGETPEDPDNQ